MTSLDPKIIMREKGIETAKPIHPASWFRDRRLQIYYRRHVLERMTGKQEGTKLLLVCRRSAQSLAFCFPQPRFLPAKAVVRLGVRELATFPTYR
jgi:predicted SAM-dependent methyltransferase